jgi:FkbM family methyltransferase
MDKLRIAQELSGFIDAAELPSGIALAQGVLQRLREGAFISYAQNYEDVILRRVYEGKRDGFYVDVGAFDPINKSTTHAFHRMGWRGMNVDVCRENIDKFNKSRPGDINVCAAVGKSGQEKEFFMLPGTTRSTTLKELASDYAARGMNVVPEKIATVSLTDLCLRHNVEKIDFISVDTEGSELDVLRSLDLKRFRPTLFIIEATYPETSIPAWQDWEPHLNAEGYRFAYFDGLNRFYLCEERTELMKHFECPPNYFDNFVRYGDIIAALVACSGGDERASRL